MSWSAHIRLLVAGDWKHFDALIDAPTHEDALLGAQYAMNAIAGGKLAIIRAEPEAVSERDFDTKLIRHRGYARCSFRDEPGEWTKAIYNGTSVPLDESGVSIGAAKRHENSGR